MCSLYKQCLAELNEHLLKISLGIRSALSMLQSSPPCRQQKSYGFEWIFTFHLRTLPLLGSLQHLHVSSVLGSPELDTTLQVHWALAVVRSNPPSQGKETDSETASCWEVLLQGSIVVCRWLECPARALTPQTTVA
uniref:Uncharacterized protein n=1 Tax=Meleagris gallopavo TaxID=9103 RepID=A0A803Y4C1_MELGA